jgi:hypothetical protein
MKLECNFCEECKKLLKFTSDKFTTDDAPSLNQCDYCVLNGKVSVPIGLYKAKKICKECYAVLKHAMPKTTESSKTLTQNIKQSYSKAYTMQLSSPLSTSQQFLNNPSYGMLKKYEISSEYCKKIATFLKSKFIELTSTKAALASSTIEKFPIETVKRSCEDKGDILINIELVSGIKLGAFSKLGWISDIKYVQDVNAGGYVIVDKQVQVFPFLSNYVFSLPDAIAFGKNGKDFLVDFNEPLQSTVNLSSVLSKFESNIGQSIKAASYNLYKSIRLVELYTEI